MTTTTLTETQYAYTQGLRDLAEWLEDNPDLIPTYGGESVFLFRRGDEPMPDFLSRIARRFGRCDKDVSDKWFYLVKSFGPHDIRASARRDEVCEQVQVGTREVTEEIPDPAHMIDVPTITVTREEPVYEWRCPESILS